MSEITAVWGPNPRALAKTLTFTLKEMGVIGSIWAYFWHGMTSILDGE